MEDASLKGLLDGLLVSHRNDIHAFSGGHLNESNLKKPESSEHKPWRSSQKPRPILLSKSRLNQSSPVDERRQFESMTSTMAAFSIGHNTSYTDISQFPKMKNDEHSRVLIEEIHLPEVMLARTMYKKPKAWVEHDLEAPISGERKPQSQGHIKDSNLAKHYSQPQSPSGLSPRPPPYSPRHKFLTGPQEAVTRRDQYAKMKEFETDVLRKQDTTETHIMSGQKAVEHHEKKLKRVSRISSCQQIVYQSYLLRLLTFMLQFNLLNI